MKYDIVEYQIKNIKGVIIKLFKSEYNCYAKIYILKELLDNKTELVEFKDYHNTLQITIKDWKLFKKKQNNFVKTCLDINDEEREKYYVIKTDKFNFNTKWIEIPFKLIPDNICLKGIQPFVKLRLIIPKKIFVHDNWFGSYKNYQKRKNSPIRSGYISNRNKANFSYNNSQRPYQGGSVSPK